jgi:hypothetical protein
MSRRYAVPWLGVFIAIPLWQEFHEPGQAAWNTFLAIFLLALVAAAFFGLRYLEQNKIDVGEARFSSSRHTPNGEP